MEDREYQAQEREWQEVAVAWARCLEISWYHAQRDLRNLRQVLGEDGARWFVWQRLGGAERTITK